MSFRAILAPTAADDIARLDVWLRNVVHEELLRLCESPATLSRRSVSPPYPPGYLQFEFNRVFGDKGHYFVVLFRYGQDEETIHIHAIGHREVTEDPDLW